MQITSRKEIYENKRTIFEKIKMFSRCAIYLHKAVYEGHLLVPNFFFSLSAGAVASTFPAKLSLFGPTWLLFWWWWGGGRRGGKAPWSSLRMTQLLFYIQSVSISKGDEVPAELFGQLLGPTETSRLWINLLAAGVGHFEYRLLRCGRFMWQPKIKVKLGGTNVHGSCLQLISMCELWQKIL